MKAMDYEYMIRRAYQCGRNYTYGADADIYRKYERNFNYLEKVKKSISEGNPEPLVKPVDDLEYEMRVAAASVKRNIEDAINKVLKDYSHKLTHQQKETLQNCIPGIFEYDKYKIEKMIDNADEIMLNIGLLPG